jgi:hypothetical protein
VAPTMLKAIGLDNNALQGVQKNNTPVLAGLGMDSSSPPGTITDLSATTIQNAIAGEVQLSWSAPADTGMPTGAPSSYDVRVSTSPITDDSWNAAIRLGDSPAAVPAGSTENLTVNGLLSAQTLYFAVKAMDVNNNESAMSNVAATTTSNGANTGGGKCGGGAAVILLIGGAFWWLRSRIHRA